MFVDTGRQLDDADGFDMTFDTVFVIFTVIKMLARDRQNSDILYEL